MSETRTPCQRTPELFKLVRESDNRRLNQTEKRTALWLCLKRCPALEACGRREPVLGHVWAGRIVTASGLVHDGVTTQDQDGKARTCCKICGTALPSKRRTYCGSNCARARQRVRSLDDYVPESTTKAEVEGAFLGTILWNDLHRPAREAVVRKLNATGEDDVKIAARFPGVTARIIRWIRSEHLGLPGHRHTGRVAV